MKTAGAHLPVVSASGSRLKLADGRELVDGIASWWTAAHGYRHPHIEAAVERQLKTLPHVMLGGLAHEQAYRLATRLAALLRSEEHTSELPSLMRTSSAVFCLQKKTTPDL